MELKNNIELENNIEDTNLEIIDDEIDVTTINDLLKLRGLLQGISNLTFNYSVLNRQHPISTIQTKDIAKQLTDSYKAIVEDVALLINNFNK